MTNNLDKIYIRAVGTDGKWGSYNLKEIYDMGKANQIWLWFIDRLLAHKEGEEISLETIDMMVNVLKICGHQVIELKD